jgi:hypothetical protein
MIVQSLLSVVFLGLTPDGYRRDVTPTSDFSGVVRPLNIDDQTSTRGGIFIPIHTPAHFPFVTIVPDDRNDPAGGWQAAKANLPFQKIDLPITLITWYCPITIGMPIRHSVRGKISPTEAATMSAAVTNSVANRMASGTDFNLPQGIFCRKFVTEVKAAFPNMYPVAATVGL